MSSTRAHITGSPCFVAGLSFAASWRRRGARGVGRASCLPRCSGPLLASLQQRLIGTGAFDPESVKPKADVDFSPHFTERRKSKKAKKAEKEDEESSQRLPKRLLLSFFSNRVGHRPTGLQTAQVILFTERFPTEFREAAMQKIILPKSMEGHPFVAPDGTLPCAALSTVNALRWLETNPGKLVGGDPKALAQIKRVLDEGVQVEWMEFSSFLEWPLCRRSLDPGLCPGGAPCP